MVIMALGLMALGKMALGIMALGKLPATGDLYAQLGFFFIPFWPIEIFIIQSSMENH